MSANDLGARTAMVLLALCLGVGGMVLASPAESGIPPILASSPERGGGAVWVAAGAASADGALRPGLFGEASRRNLEEQVRHISEARKRLPAPHVTADDLRPVMERAPYLSEDLCQTSSVTFSPPEVPRDDFESLHRHARDIVGGRITDIDQGFVNGFPSSLLEVEVETIVRSSGDFAASHSLYVVSPYAVFRIGDQTFCRKEPGYPYRPQVGDRVLLFPSSAPIDEHHVLVWPEHEEVVAEKPGGGLVVAKRLQGQEPFNGLSRLEQLIDRLRVEVERGGEGGS